MKKFLSFFLALTLVFSFSVVLSPQTTHAATDYCNTGNYLGASYGYGNVKVINGNKSNGACHIQYYHLAAPGKGSAIVDGQSKSQFSRDLSRSEMATIAGAVVSGGTNTKLSNGNYKAEAFNISVNQYVRVIYYNKVENGTTYKMVVTMYPYK